MAFTIGASQCLFSSSSNERSVSDKTRSWLWGEERRNADCFTDTCCAQLQRPSIQSPHLPFLLLALMPAADSRERTGLVLCAMSLFTALPSQCYWNHGAMSFIPHGNALWVWVWIWALKASPEPYSQALQYAEPPPSNAWLLAGRTYQLLELCCSA